MSEFRPRVLLFYGVGVLALSLVAVLGARTGRSADVASDSARAVPAMLAEMAPSTDQGSDARPQQTAYVWSASRIGSTLRLRGFVPSEEDRRTVIGMVKAHFADLEVEDRLKIAEGGPPREQWLGAVSFGLKQLSHLKQGSARLLNAGLKVEGEARSGDDYDEVKKALSGPMPTGLTVLNDNVRPPVADPFVFVASLDPNALTLSGSVPSENMRKQVKELSRRLFERPMLDDQLQLASGAPKDWNNAVEASLRALSRLDSGKVSLSGLVLTIDGVAPDKGTAIAVSSDLKRDLPALFSSSESIRWKEAVISRNAGELLAPRIKEIERIESGLTTGAIPLEDLPPLAQP
jgi:osmotically-inducible protein OsmY